MTIGEKFRKLRSERKMTQSELCGSFVTRNMLSRIEHDAALPSLETLKYLADRLDIDPGYFISEGDDPLPFIKIRLMPEIGKAFEERDFEKCLAFAAHFDKTDKELCMIFYQCCIIRGRAFLENGDYRKAREYFSKAAEFGKSGYSPETLSEFALYCIELCGNGVPGGVFEHSAPQGRGYFTKIYERSLYELLIRLFDSGKTECAAQVFDAAKLSRSVYRKHINARLSIASGNYSRARDLLFEILDKGEDAADVSFIFRVCSDLERCCKAIGDYEGAYKCVLAKSDILSKAEK